MSPRSELMAEDRKEYTVTIGGVEHTMLLDAHDAKRYGAVEGKQRTPENKGRQPRNKADK